MTKKFYVTTAIPYVNARPHLGHALELLQGDVIARYHRLLSERTLYLSGSDENSLKNVQAAEKQGLSTQKLCDQNTQAFKELVKKLNISIDVWQRGSSKNKHWPGVKTLWNKCLESGDIYKKKYKGLYCVGCEEFKRERDLIDGKCPEHQIEKLEAVEEENYFFRLSKYQEKLQELIESNKLKIIPQKRKNEALGFIKQGLEDFSISRSVKRAHGWGIPVPNDPSQIIYVWYDALAEYITGIGWDWDLKQCKQWWPADLHIIGKGINRFHTLYWPAMLLSAGLALPKSILIHGYITVEGKKMGKSIGNVIDPIELVKKYGAEAVRYYLLKEIPTTDDGDFSEARFKELYNANLANGLGNLISRVLTMAVKYSDSKVPQIDSDPDSHPLRISKKIYTWKNAYQDRDKFLAKYKLHEALNAIWKYIATADKYINDNQPWELAKKDKKKLNHVLYGLLDGIHQLAWMVYPFLPETSRKIAQALQIKKLLEKQPNDKHSWINLKPGTSIALPKSLFPRLT